MKPGSIRERLRLTLGAALLLIGAAGLAYKVISDYRHAAPDAFVSVQDQNRLPAASSAADHPVEAAKVSADAAPPRAPGDAFEGASSAAANVDLLADAQDNTVCAAIKTEQHEIERALHKQYSPEEGHYMQRRLRELAERSGKHKCGE
jgi:hypothetical protein